MFRLHSSKVLGSVFVICLCITAFVVTLFVYGPSDAYSLTEHLGGLWRDAVTLADALITQYQVRELSVDTSIEMQPWLLSLTSVIQIEPQLAAHISEWLKRYVQVFTLLASVTWLARN